MEFFVAVNDPLFFAKKEKVLTKTINDIVISPIFVPRKIFNLEES